MNRCYSESRWTAAVGRAIGIALLGFAVACGGKDAPPVQGNPDTSDLGATLLSGAEEMRQARASQAPPSGPTTAAGPIEGRTIDLSLLGHDSGAPDAPIKIVEFSDFGCGYCRQFHLESYPVIEEEYIRTGKVVWKYVPMILGIFGENAEIAAEAGECALAQDRFEGVRDALFTRQSEWKQSDDPSEALRVIVTDEGLDVLRWERCMVERERRDRVAAGTQLAQQAGVRGTPTFFILGYAPIPGALPLDLFKQVLDTVYAQTMQAQR